MFPALVMAVMAVSLLGAPARATPLNVRVYRTTSVMLSTPNAATICDDPSLVSVETTSSGVDITGRKVGARRCSFGPMPSKKADRQRVYFDVTVKP